MNSGNQLQFMQVESIPRGKSLFLEVDSGKLIPRNGCRKSILEIDTHIDAKNTANLGWESMQGIKLGHGQKSRSRIEAGNRWPEI